MHHPKFFAKRQPMLLPCSSRMCHASHPFWRCQARKRMQQRSALRAATTTKCCLRWSMASNRLRSEGSCVCQIEPGPDAGPGGAVPTPEQPWSAVDRNAATIARHYAKCYSCRGGRRALTNSASGGAHRNVPPSYILTSSSPLSEA
jgi:hypothetical protein